LITPITSNIVTHVSRTVESWMRLGDRLGRNRG